MGYLLLEGGAEFGGRMRDPDLKAIERAIQESELLGPEHGVHVLFGAAVAGLRRDPAADRPDAEDARPEVRPHREHLVDRGPDQPAAVLGVRRLQGRARRVGERRGPRSATNSGEFLSSGRAPARPASSPAAARRSRRRASGRGSRPCCFARPWPSPRALPCPAARTSPGSPRTWCRRRRR